MADTTIGVNPMDTFAHRVLPGAHPRCFVKIGTDDSVALFFDSADQLDSFATCAKEAAQDLRLAEERDTRSLSAMFGDGDNTEMARRFVAEKRAEAEAKRRFEEEDAQHSVDPDEAVA